MRMVFVIPSRIPFHPALKLTIPEGTSSDVDAVIVDARTVAAALTDRRGERLTMYRVAEPERMERGRLVPTLVSRAALHSLMKHANRVVCCADFVQFSGRDAKDCIFELAALNRHADCVFHTFFQRLPWREDWNIADTTLGEFMLPLERAPGSFWHGPTLHEAWTTLDANAAVLAEIENSRGTDVPYLTFGGRRTHLSVAMVQVLFRLRENEDGETFFSERGKAWSLKAAIGPSAWSSVVGRLYTLGFVQEQGDPTHARFVLTEQGRAAAAVLDPRLEDGCFAERVEAWSARGVGAAKPEIDAYVLRFHALIKPFVEQTGGPREIAA